MCSAGKLALIREDLEADDPTSFPFDVPGKASGGVERTRCSRASIMCMVLEAQLPVVGDAGLMLVYECTPRDPHSDISKVRCGD